MNDFLERELGVALKRWNTFTHLFRNWGVLVWMACINVVSNLDMC